MANGKFKKCPRCELNYILVEEDLCDVCKAELGLDSKIILLDDIIEDDEPLKLCPICKTAYIGMDETMCENCIAHEQSLQEPGEDEDSDDWRSYLDDDDTDVDDGDEMISLEEFGETEDSFEEEFEDEENMDLDLDDYPDDDFDDLDDLDDYDDDDDDDDLD